MQEIFLSIVVPAYNEVARIGGSLDRLRDFLETIEHSWEIVVVDDGSTDGTAGIVAEHASSETRIRLISVDHGGKGAAVKKGMIEAVGKWRFLSDADLSMPPDNLSRFFGPGFSDPAFDVSIGSREAAGSRRIEEPWSRHFLGRIFNWTVKLVAIRGIEDTQCGFKLYSAEAADAVFPLQRVKGWAFDVENLFIARQAGFSVGEVPIDWQYHRGGKVTLVSSAVAYLDIFRVRLNQLFGRYSAKDAG